MLNTWNDLKGQRNSRHTRPALSCFMKRVSGTGPACWHYPTQWMQACL